MPCTTGGSRAERACSVAVHLLQPGHPPPRSSSVKRPAPTHPHLCPEAYADPRAAADSVAAAHHAHAHNAACSRGQQEHSVLVTVHVHSLEAQSCLSSFGIPKKIYELAFGEGQVDAVAADCGAGGGGWGG